MKSTTLVRSARMATILGLAAIWPVFCGTPRGQARCPRIQPSYAPAEALASEAPASPKEASAEPKAPEGQAVLFKLHAEGVQIYELQTKKDAPNEFQWVLKGPDAVLTDDKGGKAGQHHGSSDGPTWESKDGSRVIATLPPVEITPKPPAVPWLLLKAKSTEGNGQFSKVTFIRRIDTEGGAAPAPPDAPKQGTEARVPYKATYIFYGAAP